MNAIVAPRPAYDDERSPRTGWGRFKESPAMSALHLIEWSREAIVGGGQQTIAVAACGRRRTSAVMRTVGRGPVILRGVCPECALKVAERHPS